MQVSSKEINKRTIALIGEDKFNALQKSHVVVFGLGGVGSYCATALARAGVGALTIIDFDLIDASNINRQEFAKVSTVGMPKVDIAEQILLDINPDLKLIKYQLKVDEGNVSEMLKQADCVIDCIDDVPAKVAISKYCEDHGINHVSCMGTALRLDASKFQFGDIFETSVCPLCKSVRKLARNAGIQKMNVLYSTEVPLKKTGEELGSCSFVPPVAGMMLAGYAIKHLASID